MAERNGRHDDRDAARLLEHAVDVGRTGGAERAGGATPARAPQGPLQWAAAEFERVQAARIATGEQLRAVLQGRAVGWGVVTEPLAAPGPLDPDTPADGTAPDVEALLRAIRQGHDRGPVPLLGAAYQRYAREERELRGALATILETHPAWAWLGRVRGIGPTLAARLLSRLRIERAPTPSAFWRYCGLGTDVVATPDAAGTDGTPGTVRVAQPRLRRGEAATYNPAAKVVCYLIGLSLMRQGGAYKAYYRERRAGLEVTRADWTAARRHLGALRSTEKLLLVHLWTAWRAALGLPLLGPYTRPGHRLTRVLEPSDMLDDP